MKNFLLLFGFCSLGQLCAESMRMNLETLCSDYRQERVENGHRIISLSQYPVISEELRSVAWTKIIRSEEGNGRYRFDFWRHEVSATLNEQFEVENFTMVMRPADMIAQIQSKRIPLKESPEEALKSHLEIIIQGFKDHLKNSFYAYGRHMGYPLSDINTADSEILKFGKTTAYKEGDKLEFGGIEFEVLKGQSILLVVPTVGAVENARPFLLRIHEELVKNSVQGFSAIGIFSAEFICESGVKQTLNIAGGIDDNVIKRVDDEKQAQLGVEKVKFHTVPDEHIGHRLQMMYVPEKYWSQVTLSAGYNWKFKIDLVVGDLIQSIDGIPVRTKADLEKVLARPPEQLGQTMKILILSQANRYRQKSGLWELKEIEVRPDDSEMARQRELIAEHARIEEDARQSVITLHEEERARIRKEVIEFRKQAELEVLKTKEGIIDLVRQRVQPAIIAFAQELADDDPLWAISYLKYLAHAQPDALTVKQREKLYGVVWMAQDTRLDSYAHFDLNVSGASKLALENGVSLTPLNTKPSRVSVAKGEMVFNDGDSYLLLDHPAILLEFILDDEKNELTVYDTFLISDCGICTPNEFYYFERENLKEYAQLSFIREKDSLTGYQEIVTASRDYESYEIPQPKRRTLAGLLFKGWVVATVSANVMFLGAEAMGVDTDDLLREAQKGALEPKATGQVKVTKMISQVEKMSTWTGKSKGHAETLKLSNGANVSIYQITPNNGSIRSKVPGWYVSSETALKYSLRVGKAFSKREEVIEYIESGL